MHFFLCVYYSVFSSATVHLSCVMEMVNGELWWRMEDGGWRMEMVNGESWWRMEDGGWRMDDGDGEWRMEDGDIEIQDQVKIWRPNL